jgi:hypothetical protein
MADLATTNVGSAVRHRQAAAATAEAGARLVAQSIARSGGDVAAEHEQMVLEAGGTVIRYGFFSEARSVVRPYAVGAERRASL